MRPWFAAAAGRLGPFILVVEGAVPNEELSGDGHWAAFGVDPAGGQPITTSRWIDRLTPHAGAVVAMGTCAAYGGIPAMRNNPTGAMGVRDYLGAGWTSGRRCARRQRPRLPRAARQHHRDAGPRGAAPGRRRAHARARRAGTAGLAVRAHGAAGLRPRGLRRAGRVRPHAGRRPRLPGQARLQRARWRCATCRSAAGPEASAAAPTSAASASPARCPGSPTSSCPSCRPTRSACSPPTPRVSPTDRCCAGCAAVPSSACTTSSPRGGRPGDPVVGL